MNALLLGAIGSSALVLGGVAGSYWRPPMRVTGVLLAFASGTLISALAFELFPEAVERAGLLPAGLGLVAGAVVFIVVNTWLDARVAENAGDPHAVPAVPAEVAEPVSGAQAEQTERLEAAAGRGNQLGVGLALVAAVTLDGVPENAALGVSLVADATGSIALLVAIFASNFPESLAGAAAMRRGGRSPGFAIGIWAVAAVLLTLAAVGGNAAVAAVSAWHLAFALAFAGGAVLASLADTLMPEAFEHGRPLNSLATTIGFFVSFVLSGG